MNYLETIQYLYASAPMFQNIGAGAYKEGLATTETLDEYFNHPHRNFKTIHIAGTNGKGSTSHSIAAILQSAGYKVGLYTSPHLVDFRERIRVNGKMISEQGVIDFVEKHRGFFEPLKPSFFELTTAMAFKYFADEKVDIAIVEVGLGGRLDCTNIISPCCSVITNISFDHTQFLGKTLAQIATEKAGIIKSNTPVVIGEYVEETRSIFHEIAKKNNSPIYYAQDDSLIISKKTGVYYDSYRIKDYDSELNFELRGLYQEKNLNTILWTIKTINGLGFEISDAAIWSGLSHVCELTGLMGRWQILNEHPQIVCDTGHNVGGFQYIVPQLLAQSYKQLRFVFGMVGDKDVDAVLSILPTSATYYFTQAKIPRALNAETLKMHALNFGLCGETYPTVSDALKAAVCDADSNDFIFVGGSSFVVADLLSEGHYKLNEI